MISLRRLNRVVARPRYFPFTEPRYKGHWPFKQFQTVIKSGRAKYIPSSFAALPFRLGRWGTAVSAEAAPMRKWGSAAWGTKRAAGKDLPPVVSPIDPRRWEEIHRRAVRKPNWRPNPSQGALSNFIEKYGMAAFRSKVCEERRQRREVLHAKAIAGTRVARPTFDARSMVIC